MTKVAVRAIRRLMLLTGRGPLRPLWRAAHEAFLRALAAYLRGLRSPNGAYASGSVAARDAIFGLSDFDVAIVVPGAEEEREVKRRCARVAALPALAQGVDAAVFRRSDLWRMPAATIFTFGLGEDRAPPAYGEAAGLSPAVSLLERPRLYAPLGAWRHLSGPDHRPPTTPWPRAEARLVGWLALQRWWGLAFEACLHPERPETALLCVKLVAEPARVWLWLARGERTAGRVDALERALRALPEEEAPLRDALELFDALPHGPEPPLASALRGLAGLSGRVAEHIAGETEAAGTTTVRLVGAADEVGTLPEAAEPAPGARRLPLADWRARALSLNGDEALDLLPGDPTQPAAVVAGAQTERIGLVPALLAGGLLVEPSTRSEVGRTRLRAVQCAASDPVSFALLADRDAAEFPNLPGWSALDCARRAVAETRGWLAAEEGRNFPRLLGGLRAALFERSIRDGEPTLAVTAAATARLADDERAERLLEWRAARGRGEPDPPDDEIDALVQWVLGLPAYAQ